MSYTTDNRWSPNAGIAPANARAVYSARWIDNGDYFDVLPDRQGFAYDEAADRDELIDALNTHQPRRMTMVARSDTHKGVITAAPFHVWMRRFGGYVYTEAWLEAS